MTMIATEDTLYEVARAARAAKALGATTIEFDIAAYAGWTKFVRLWEGTLGEVIGRTFEHSAEPNVSGIVRPRVVKYFRVRARITDICEAQRRRMEREAREFGSSTA
jgi:hypothetical protein